MKTIVVSTGLLAFLTILYQLEIKIIIKKSHIGPFQTGNQIHNEIKTQYKRLRTYIYGKNNHPEITVKYVSLKLL